MNDTSSEKAREDERSAERWLLSKLAWLGSAALYITSEMITGPGEASASAAAMLLLAYFAAEEKPYATGRGRTIMTVLFCVGVGLAGFHLLDLAFHHLR